jgi:biotin carboxyl carrier protein
LTFEIEVGGRTRVVAVHGTAPPYEVTVDGRRVAVDVARVGGAWSLILGPAAAAGDDGSSQAAGGRQEARSYEVSIEPQPSGGLTVHVDGKPIPVAIAAGGPSGGRAGGGGWRQRALGAGPDAKSGPQHILAPMPGRVVKVLVKVGDSVAARQGVVVVEAMKMENELRSPKAGTVTEVRAAEGALVEARAVLVVIA